jgi:putative transposase
LIVDGGKKPENISLLMKRVSGRQTRYVNKLQRRSGTLWEGRYRSSLINRDEYLLSCCRYIELNPIQAGMVELPEEYKWSSYRDKIGESRNRLTDVDMCYKGLGETEERQIKNYKKWTIAAIPNGEWKMIGEALQRGQLTGSNRFIEQIEKRIGERIESRGQGRPKKIKK